ncbi:MAG: hypothetical protein HYX68_03060 [Planctomycetes bacterium]|nr:hypothetical protein [Planctomycetota bacterium]
MIASHADELVDALSELRILFPDWRMGQLIANLVTAAGGMDANAIWDMQDEKLLAAARRLIERNQGRAGVLVKQSGRTTG